MGPSRLAALSSSGGASLPRLVTNAIWARTRSAWACCASLSGPASAMASSSPAASKAPAWTLACAAASARPARRAGSRVSVAACFRNAAAAARPPRAWARPAERSSSAATSSSGPGAACARCQARRSGSSPRIGGLRQCAVRLLLFPRRRRLVDHRADQRVAEPHPGAELGQARFGRGRRRFGADAQPRWLPATPAPGRRSGRPPRAAAAAGPGRESVTRRPEALFDAPGQRHCAGEPEPAGQLGGRQSARQFQQRQRVAPRLGDELVPDPGVDRPGQHRLSSARASASRSPPTANSGSPARSLLGSRAANTRPTDSAPRRRATNARTCAEA